jgi:ABC-type branched-subunit amino acid transport system substrate-binding protein
MEGGVRARGVARIGLALGLALAAAGAAAQGQAIQVGQTIALTGGTAEHGKAVLLGIQAHLERVNAAGGVGGRRVVLTTLDDAGSSAKAAENTATLIDKDNVVAIFGGIEGGPCVASMKVAVEKKVPLVACMAGSPDLRDPVNRYVFPVRAEHFDEFARLIDVAVESGAKRIGFLHADSDTGRKHLANVRKLLAKHQLDVAAAIPIPADKADPRALAGQIAAAKIDVVFNHGSYALYGEIIRSLRSSGTDVRFMAVNSGAQQMVRALGKEAHGIVFTQVVPYPWGATPPVVAEYRAALKAIAPTAEPSFSSLEGFISAKVLVAGLRKAAKPTREDLVAGLEQLGEYDAGGLLVTYRPGVRTGATLVDTVLATSSGRFVR